MNDRARTLTQADIDAATGWRPAAIAHAGGAGYDDGEPAPAHTTRMVLGLSAVAMIVLITFAVALVLAYTGRMPWA